MAEKKQMGVVVKGRGRLSFPHLFERDSFKRFSALIIVEPGSDFDKAIGAAINQAAKNCWGSDLVEYVGEDGKKENIPAFSKQLRRFIASGDICYQNGNKKTDSSGNIYPGFEGKKFLSAVSPDQPTLLDEARNLVTSPEQGKLYGGADVYVVAEIWPQNGPRYYGVRCQLQGIQHYADGARFGGGRKAGRDEFADAPVNPDGNDDLVGDGGGVGGNPDADITF